MSFREIEDKWYLDRMKEIQERPKKYSDWMIADGMLYKHTKDKLMDPLYGREEAWRLVVPENYREQVPWDAHN